MSEQKEDRGGSSLDEARATAEKVKGAAKTGKAIAQIAKGAATGGLHGAAIATVSAFKKQFLIVAIVLIMLPVLFILLLPALIFGAIFGSNSVSGVGADIIMNDNAAIIENISEVNNTVAQLLTEAYESTLSSAQSAASSKEYSEIVDTVGGNIVFDANMIICWYSAAQSKDIENLNLSDLSSKVSAHKSELYYYEVTTERRQVREPDGEGGYTTKTVTFYIYTIYYKGDDYFPSNVFTLTDEELELAENYASNLTIFLYDSYEAAGNGAHATIRELTEGDTTPLRDGVFGNPFPGRDWTDEITSTFGRRAYPGVGTGTTNHTGLDIGYATGTTIHAVMDGTVLFTRDSGSSGYGKYLVIYHGGGYATLYAHCSRILVSDGDEVSKGDSIAEVGETGWTTGPHLHIEVIIDGVPVDPINYISTG